MTRIPWIAGLYPNADIITAQEIVSAVQTHFPDVTVDWDRGDAHVLRSIELLRSMHTPDSWIEARKRSLGQVAHLTVRDHCFPDVTASFYAKRIERDLGDRLEVVSEPETKLPFLKQVTRDLAERLNFRHLLTTDESWGMEILAQPDGVDPLQFARQRFPHNVYGPLTLRSLREWERSLSAAVPRWFEQSASKCKPAMVQRVGTVDEIAEEMIATLKQLDPVQSAWVVDVDAPFGNVLILQHHHWVSATALNGAAKGILS